MLAVCLFAPRRGRCLVGVRTLRGSGSVGLGILSWRRNWMSGLLQSGRLNARFVVVGRWVLSTGSGVAAGGFDDRSAFGVGSIGRFESALTCSFGCFADFDRFGRLIERFDRSSDRSFERFDRSDRSTDYSDH